MAQIVCDCENSCRTQQDGTIRQQLIEHLMREIMRYDAEFAVRMQPPNAALMRPCRWIGFPVHLGQSRSETFGPLQTRVSFPAGLNRVQ